MGTEAMYNHTIDWNVSSQPLMGFLCIPEINIWHNDNNNNIHNNHIKEMIMINQQKFSISFKNNSDQLIKSQLISWSTDDLKCELSYNLVSMIHQLFKNIAYVGFFGSKCQYYWSADQKSADQLIIWWSMCQLNCHLIFLIHQLYENIA